MSLIPVTDDIDKLEDIVKSNFKNKSKEFLKAKHTCYYNCWGFTAFFLNFRKKLSWIEDDVMDELLENHTVRVWPRHVQKGDIAVYRRLGYLKHTAIVLDSEHILHKPGSQPLETELLLDNCYTRFGTKITYRRLKTPLPIN